MTDPKRLTINVGLDFGTYSTKVLYQVMELAPEPNTFFIDWDFSDSHYPPYTLPSMAILKAGRLFFAERAFYGQQRADCLFKGFKMCLSCYKGINECKGCRSLGLNSLEKGQVVFNDCDFNAFEITIYYLAFVIQSVEGRIRRRWRDSFDPKFYYNVCFPQNYLREKKHERIFYWIVEAALRIAHGEAGGIYHGITVQEARRKLEEIYQNHRVDWKARPFRLIVETRAAMHSLSQAGYLRPQIYAVADIGASTTDMAIFRLGRDEFYTPSMSLYADESYFLGGQDIDAIFLGALSKVYQPNGKPGGLLGYLEEGKDAYFKKGKFEIEALGIVWNNAELQAIQREIIDKLHSYFSRLLREKAYPKEQNIKVFQNPGLMLIGGGGQWGFLKKAFTTSPFIGKAVSFSPELIETELPDNIYGEGVDLTALRNHFHFFTVAHGLSYFAYDIMEMIAPGEIDNFKPIPEQVPLPDTDELYF